jgi:integrase
VAACAASRSRSLLPGVSLALATGLRHDELRLLRWSQVDVVNEAIRVGKSKTDHGSGRAVPRLAAAKELADRLHGRAIQAVEIDDRPDVPVFVFPPGTHIAIE